MKRKFIIVFFLIIPMFGGKAQENKFGNKNKIINFQQVEIPLSDPAIVNSGVGWHLGYEWGPAASSYDVATRIIWRDLEPVRDKYDFTKIEELLNKAQTRGGRANIRFRAVATSGIGVPDYMVALMPKGFWKDWLFNKKPETFAYVPDWNDPDFIERAKALLNAIGKRYNNDPRLGILDIGMYGRWGEWHCSGIKYPTPDGAQEITEENIKAIIDMHIQAFPNKRLVMMTDNLYGLKYALQKSDKIGWRRDSYGTDWFQDPERMEIVRNRWQTAPVVAEPIGEFAPGAIGFCKKMAQQSKEFHVATIHGINTFKKDVKYNDEEIIAVIDAGKNSGFRFLINSISIPQRIAPGVSFLLTANWENGGVTPAYEKWEVVYQLRNQKNGKISWEGISSVDLEKLLPTNGDLINITDTFVLAHGIKKGSYDLVVTVKDKETDYRKPMALAMRNRMDDGGYKLGAVQVLPK